MLENKEVVPCEVETASDQLDLTTRTLKLVMVSCVRVCASLVGLVSPHDEIRQPQSTNRKCLVNPC